MSIELQFMPLRHDSSGNIYESANSIKSREIFDRSNNSVHDSLVVLHGPYTSGKSTIAQKIIEMFKSEYKGRVTVVDADEQFDGRVEKKNLLLFESLIRSICHLSSTVTRSSIVSSRNMTILKS